MPIGRASSAFPVTPLLAVLLLAACTFDPLANWQAPRGGSFTVGDAIVVGDADVGSYDLLPAPFRVTGIDPERGDPAGDEAVVITGVGFVSGMEVTFNDVPAQYVQAQDGERLYLRTPAGAPGPADVRVIHPDGREELMKQAFLYGVPVEVASVEPDHGPAAGGTPVTVRGTGFLDGTTVVLGGRLLINLEQLDDTTVIGITAGGAPGPVDVIATNAVGAAQSADLFRYEAPVALYAIAPAFGASAGGDSVVLAGSGLSHDAEVQFLPADGEARVAEITGWNESGSRLQLRSPAGPVGAADVVVSVPGQGSVRLAGAWSWRSEAPEQAPLALVGVHPNTGAAAGGESVLLVTTGLPADAAPAVHFGEATAAVLGVDTETGLVAVQSPAGGPGRVDVSLTVDGERVAADDGFLYRASVALASVTPSAGTAEGGTEVVLRGVGFGPSAFVRFGALAAAAVEVVDEETIVCRTPPGSPGWVDVVVSFDDEALDAPAGSTYRLADAFEYEFGGTALFAVSPTRGSVAGGTYVELYGAEFPTRPLVRFGSWQAEDVTRVSPSKIVAYTPMVREAGALDVGVSGPEGAGVLLWGYAFFDPMGDGVGTWGPTVDGAINVTVLDAETDEPLPGAFAMLGTAAETPYQGWTDVNGQTTLSGPALRGPQLVSAAAPEYSAASYVEVDAENVVIELQPDNPQGSSGGGAGTTLPLGSLAGVIDNPDKYVPVPVASCDDVPTDSDPLCRPCESDEDCADPDSALAELACSDLGEDGGRCTSICGEGCPSGFSCTPLGGEARCVPSLGVRGVRCEITRRSPFWYAETESADVDMFTGAYLLESRLGDVAIVCLGGYEEWETGRFVGTRMGVLRHAYSESATLTPEQDVELDIPLGRTVLFRLDPALPGPDEPDYLGFQVSLDFGSDGVYVLGEQLEADAAGLIKLERVPTSFVGDLYDAGLTISAGRYTPDELVSTPYAELYLEGLADADLDQPQVLVEQADGGWAFEAPVFVEQPLAVWQDATTGDRAVVGEDGLLLWYSDDDGWALAPSIDSRTLRALDGPDLSNLVAVGDGGAVLRYDGVSWTDLEPPLNADLYDVWVAGPDRFIAVGAFRIAEYSEGTWTIHKITSDLRGVHGRHWEDVVAVGRDGALLHRGAEGWGRAAAPAQADLHDVWLDPQSSNGVIVGAVGLLLAGNGEGWDAVSFDAPVTADLWALHARTRDDIVAVGDFGTVLRFDGRTWTAEEDAAPRNAVLSSVYAAGDGRWAAVGPRAVTVGPLLPVMQFEIPDPEDPSWEGRHMRWTNGEGTQPAATIMSVVNSAGLTRWYVIAPGHRHEVQLPDLAAAAGFTPVPPDGTLRLRAQQAYWPSFDIDNLLMSGISLSDWISWTYHYLVIERD